MKNTHLLFFLFLTISAYSQHADTTLDVAEIDSLFAKVDQANGQRDFDQSFELLDQVEEKILPVFGKESLNYANYLHKRGEVFNIQGAYAEVEPLWLESIAIQESVLGKTHQAYAKNLNSLGILYFRMGKFEKVESCFLEVLAIQEKRSGKANAEYAKGLNNLGNFYFQMGNYEKTEAFYLEAKSIRAEVLGKNDPEYSRSLNNLGLLYTTLNKYEQAEPLYQESLAIKEKLLGKAHPEYGQSLANLGGMYAKMGHYEIAVTSYLEAKMILEKSLGKAHPDYIRSISYIGNLYSEMGNYEQAEPLILEANELLKKALGNTHPHYINSLNNLGLLYFNMSNYDQAERIYLEALELMEKALGRDHPHFATCLYNLGGLYVLKGMPEKAEPLFLEALSIQEEKLGKTHLDYANSLEAIGFLYIGTHQYEQAEPHFQESLRIKEKALGKNHPDYINHLNNLGGLYLDMGRFEQAEASYLEALEIQPTVNGLYYLGNLYAHHGEYEKAAPFFLEANELVSTQLIRASHHLSEKELSAFIQGFVLKQNQFASFVRSWPDLSGTSYDNALFHKGFLLQTAQGAERLARADSISGKLLLDHKSFQRRLAAEYAKPIAEQQNVEALEAQANALEKELTRSVAGYGEAIRQVKWPEVQQQLRPGEAAVEFIHHKFFDLTPIDSTFYAAIVLRYGDKEPLYVPLFEEKALTSLLASHKDNQGEAFIAGVYTRGVKPRVNSQTKGLYELIWQPLDSLLADTKSIYASPSGLLHRLNLGSIMTDDSLTFADRYRLITLGSTRQIAMWNRDDLSSDGENFDEQALTAIFYGGIRYEIDSSALQEAIPENPLAGAADKELRFAYLERSASERSMNWNYLPGTEREVKEIGAIVSRKKGEVKILKAQFATEESFKQLGQDGPSPQILHLATHGYFFPDPEESVASKQSAVGSFDSSPSFKISDHPMIRSGLILAGGNHAWHTGKPLRPDMEDGILTAYEISQMNLDSTELVVLSACETGLGDIEGNEGVYGLQRAFKIAGVKNIIMSLWSVPDQQTQEMMVAFYEHWLNEGMELADAFRTAQREMREKYEDHYYWAGFVLIE